MALGSSDCYTIKSFTLSASQAPSGTFSYPLSPYCTAASAAQLPTATVTSGGTYTADPAGLSIDSLTGALNPSLSATGTYTITYTIPATTTCPEFHPQVTVVINPAPLAPTVTSPVTYCQDSQVVPLSASGTNLLWYSAPSGGTGIAVAPIPDTATPGSTNYYVSQSNTGCESPRTVITVNVTATPPPPIAVTPIGYCQGDAAAALTATGSGLLWYTLPSGGIGNATAPVPETTAVGTTYYYVSQSLNSCESVRTAIEVTVSAPPPPPGVISPVVYCRDDAATPLTANGNNLLWYTSATGGTGSVTAPVPDTSALGNTTYYVSQSSSGCEGSRAAITINVTDTPPAPAIISPITYCQGEAAAALTATGTNLKWYLSPNGGKATSVAPVPDTGTAGTFHYYVSQSSGSCESVRAHIIVTVYPLPDPQLPVSGALCTDSETGLLISPFVLDTGLSVASYDFEWFIASGTSYTPINGAIQNTYVATSAGTYGVRATDTATGCASDIITCKVIAQSPPL